MQVEEHLLHAIQYYEFGAWVRWENPSMSLEPEAAPNCLCDVEAACVVSFVCCACLFAR